MPACHLRHDRARRKRFRDDPPRVRVTRPSPATNATANLNAPLETRKRQLYGRPYMRTDAFNRFASSELCRSLQDGGKTGGQAGGAAIGISTRCVATRALTAPLADRGPYRRRSQAGSGAWCSVRSASQAHHAPTSGGIAAHCCRRDTSGYRQAAQRQPAYHQPAGSRQPFRARRGRPVKRKPD